MKPNRVVSTVLTSASVAILVLSSALIAYASLDSHNLAGAVLVLQNNQGGNNNNNQGGNNTKRVPEPSLIFMLGTMGGLAAVGGAVYRRLRK